MHKCCMRAIRRQTFPPALTSPLPLKYKYSQYKYYHSARLVSVASFRFSRNFRPILVAVRPAQNPHPGSRKAFLQEIPCNRCSTTTS